jgi:transposase
MKETQSGIASPVGSTSRRQRRQFDETFKRMVVGQIERGQTSASIARSYELDPKMLRTWRREFGRQPHGAVGVVSAAAIMEPVGESLALMEARRHLREVEEERDILKKALGVFSRHQR